ncbi:GbsR/MarR family transcriptional regulator [Nocardia australiensis]|uniref:GbsR/MarR family transcriptional regulator n=1 Tax=Nocardia australiensis TaxID=2887191 RepID=UPI001D15B51E|nr:MarR family transcriptional regulator [Nocardia australiensis]
MSDPTDSELDFVDEVAAFFAREGLPLISGRVIGWLLICEPAEQSAAELADALAVSRSSISTATRMLTPSGLVEGVRKRGERQEYFRIAADGWSRMLESRYAKTTAFRHVTERGLEVLDGASPQRRERLSNVAELYRFLEGELPTIWARWEQHRIGPDRRKGLGESRPSS